MAFTIRHTSGYVCVPMTAAELDRLALPLMVEQNTERMGTAYTVSVDAREGITTGISAADRGACCSTCAATRGGGSASRRATRGGQRSQHEHGRPRRPSAHWMRSGSAAISCGSCAVESRCPRAS
jgi:hypothetical protein